MRFDSEKALKYLLRKREVLTLRKNYRPRVIITTTLPDGKLKKIGRAYAIIKGHAYKHKNNYYTENEKLNEKLNAYLNQSGFSTVEEWIQEYEKLNKKSFPKFPKSILLLKIILFHTYKPFNSLRRYYGIS